MRHTIFRRLREIQEVLDSEKIDLIHIEPSYVWLGLPLTNIPIVAVEHNIEHDVYARMLRTCDFRYFDGF